MNLVKTKKRNLKLQNLNANRCFFETVLKCFGTFRDFQKVSQKSHRRHDFVNCL
ncbi:hypothetical protein LEP1GSC133_3351 [Leptospira borgpetersenii serovar Pomona str. 200901868]|uniref:Uncharacterized protein n=1 Tax=Leptospira borgpetersenii serovar Pomona str. 200901868 TaxID=1192866 RepID=M6W1V2_LEPBO|nr:hypothetical protein LEP1GSC133_3351 [Leptospira borgpetersenii serovar Pomona str. 200901868]